MSNKRKQPADDITVNLILQYTADKKPRCGGEIFKFLTEEQGLTEEQAEEGLTQLARWSPEKISCRKLCFTPTKQAKGKAEAEGESESDSEATEEENIVKKPSFKSDEDRVYSYAGTFYKSQEAKEAKKNPHIFETLFEGRIGIIVLIDPLSMKWGENDAYRATTIEQWLGDHIFQNINVLKSWNVKLNDEDKTAIATCRLHRKDNLLTAKSTHEKRINLYNERNQMFHVTIKKPWRTIRMSRKPVHSSRTDYGLLVLEFTEKNEL